MNAQQSLYIGVAVTAISLVSPTSNISENNYYPMMNTPIELTTDQFSTNLKLDLIQDLNKSANIKAETITSFVKAIAQNSVDMDPEIIGIVNENIWELI
jgi:hypothetical protein